MKRKQPKTSIEAFNSIKENRHSTYAKIIKAGTKMPNGGNFEDYARRSGLKPEQVWKRMSELTELRILIPTGETKPTSSGRSAMVRKLNPIIKRVA